MSDNQVRGLIADSIAFTREMTGARWLADNSVADINTSNPSDLFASDIDNRPLVVGLFGGTGVGKSSLLNRLAGADIARTGVVRPTSMEITAYLHESWNIAALPDGFPRQQFSETRHNNFQYADVMWVDMPDFDSDEIQNRTQVTQWLPHIDVLLYVVTPERYKDEQGWRMLLDHGYRHGWLFVMNQWDRAEDIQRDDFIRLLTRAGFQDPLLFRTICNQAENPDDDFKDLSALVSNLAERNLIEQLDKRGWLHRLKSASVQLEDHLTLLSTAECDKTLRESFEAHWSEFSATCAANLEIPFNEFSLQFADKKTGPLASMLKSMNSTARKSTALEQVARRAQVSTLWDDWSVTRLADTVNQFESDIAHSVPATRLAALTDSVESETSAGVSRQLQAGLSESMANPGTPLQRIAARISRWLCIALPLAAFGWIIYRVVLGFVNGIEDPGAYVGLDFLVNGFIMAGLAWLVPWLIGRLLNPSIPRSVQAGLHRGLSEGLSTTAESFMARLDDVSAERIDFLGRGHALQKSIKAISERSLILANPELSKMLLAYPGVQKDR